jgi:uncharacterized protein YceH (UPF0502 family)
MTTFTNGPSRCSAITAAGNACGGVPVAGDDKCYMHSASTLEERKANGARGGRRARGGRGSLVSAELARLQGVFEDLAGRIESGEVDRASAAVMIQAYNGARSCVASILKAREIEDLEVRLAELEERYGDNQRNASLGGY